MLCTTPVDASGAPAAPRGGCGIESAGPFAGRTLAELAAALRSGAVSSVELIRAALAFVEDVDPQVRAFAHVDSAGALLAATEADRELASGTDRGPLHGLPVGIKDVIDVAGLPTSAGSAHLVGRVARADAVCVRRLREAGAVVLGKTTTHEFAYGPTGDRSVHGPTRNPRDLARMAGGSSSGSAAAVAAGMVPLALGTDTGGSVRVPAALCGVAAFKPAFGAVPTDGVFPLAESLDHVGVLATTAEDCLAVARFLADPAATRRRATGTTASAGPRPRVAWLTTGDPGHAEPRVAETVHAALVAAHGSVPHVEWAWLARCREAFTAVQSREAVAVHRDRMRDAPELFDAEVLQRLRAASRVSARDLAAALVTKKAAVRAARTLFEAYDILAMPTVPVPAPPLQARELLASDGTVRGVRDTLLSLTSPWNLLGLPAFSVPAGHVDGLPVGLQFVCRPGAEATAAAMADHVARPV